MSFMTALTFSPVCVPLTKIAVLESSTSFGSRASMARFDRAFLGFLYQRSRLIVHYESERFSDLHCSQHCGMSLDC